MIICVKSKILVQIRLQPKILSIFALNKPKIFLFPNKKETHLNLK